MGLNRFDVIKEINLYSSENNKKGLIQLLCALLDDESFKNDNMDLVYIIISIGELYGYYSYIKDRIPEPFDYSESIRRNMYKSFDNSIYYNSGQLSLLKEIEDNQKVFISAPTTFGKTKLVLEYISLHKDSLFNILFIVPTNSLSEEIYIKILKYNRSVNNIYQVSTNPKFNSGKNILILTPEKYLLLLESKNPSFDLYVMDESYKIEEEQDASEKDDPLNTRSSKFRRIMDTIARKDGKVIYLSPYTYNADDSMKRFFSKYNIVKIDRKDNYVNKEIFRIEGSADFKQQLNNDVIGFTKMMSGVDKASRIIKELKSNTIVYVRYPSEALSFIAKCESSIDLNNISPRFRDFIKHIELNYEFDDSKWYILDGLKKGIGVYVSPMPRYIKREIINLFNNEEINKLVVTSAFAEGVNSSAKNIIITNDIVGGNIKMTPLDLLNLSGRAGRFGIHSQGNVYTVKNEVYTRINDCIANDDSIRPDQCRSIYDIEMIDDEYLNGQEMTKKNELEEIQQAYELTNDDLNIALSISKEDKLKLYSYFSSLNEEDFPERKQVISNISSEEKSKIIESMEYIFKELHNAGVEIRSERGTVPAFSNNNTFLWGKFYGIHSSGNIKEILKNRKNYIQREYNRMVQEHINVKDSWIDEFISNGIVDNFKLYNQAFKFISNIIEYRIPFYIGFYISMYQLYCMKNNYNETVDYDIVEISNSLENKNLEEQYNKLLEYGFSLDMINRIKEGNNTIDLLDDYEKTIYQEYIGLVE